MGNTGWLAESIVPGMMPYMCTFAELLGFRCMSRCGESVGDFAQYL